MTEIITRTICLAPYLSKTQVRQLRQIIMALLCIPGRVTMLSLSRWSEEGGSSRTIQRWFQTTLDWGVLVWAVIKAHVLDPKGVYLLAGDDVVVSKAGKKTHGVGRFYSSLAQRPIPSLSFFALSLIDVNQRRSYPVALEQHILAAKAPEPVSQAAKRGRGRPKGSKNHAKTTPMLSAELRVFQSLLHGVLSRIAPLPVNPLGLDGYFGTYPARWVVRECGLPLISKLRHNAALYFPYSGPKPKRGPPPRYGDKLEYKALPESAHCASFTDEHALMDTYQVIVLPKDF